MQTLAVTFEDVAGAAERLRGVAHRTPAITSATLDARTGARVFLKAENLQRMGAFKFRGAYNRLAQLDAAGARAGVVAFSSGNHAQGVALAAKLLGMPATIVMPTDAPLAKLAATRGYGAEVVLYDRMTMNRAEIAQALVDERGATLVPPYDDPMIIAGAGHDRDGVDRRRGSARRADRVHRRRRLALGLRARRVGPRARNRDLRRRAGGGRRLGAVARAQRTRDDSRAGDHRRRIANAIARRADVSDRRRRCAPAS